MMYKSCTSESFYDCGERHVGISLQLANFETTEQRDEFYELLKKLIEQNLDAKIVSWSIIQKTDGHYQNVTTQTHIFKGTVDPMGNRSDDAGVFKQ